MNGRGAWAVSGKGGTLQTDGKRPGPYYCLAASGTRKVGDIEKGADINGRAVKAGVVAIQRALGRRRFKVKVTGVFDAATKAAVAKFQSANMPGQNPWGGVGPETAKALFLWDVKVRGEAGGVDWRAVCGIIQNESNYDPGAVGYLDPTDLGLAQINGRAHPDLTEEDRFQPMTAITFVVEYLTSAMETFHGNERDAVASYNLGAGGTRTWIKAGRPDMWTPAGAKTPRDVKGYIDRILSACAE